MYKAFRPALPAKQLGQPCHKPIAVPKPQIIGVDVVLVVILDPPHRFKAQMLVKGEGVLVTYSSVTRDALGIVCDRRDQPFPEAPTPILRMNPEKKNVAVPSGCCKPDQFVIVKIRINGGLSVRVGEKAPPLFEEILGLPDEFFEFPGGLEVVVLTRWDGSLFEGDTHYTVIPSPET
jgi:hypothetical protein